MSEPRVRVSATSLARANSAPPPRKGEWRGVAPAGVGFEAARACSARCSASCGRRPGSSRTGPKCRLEGPVALVDSIAPQSGLTRKHVIHVIFAADVSGSLEDVTSQDTAVRGHRAFRLRSSTRSRCTRRSRGSFNDGSRVIRRSTSARCGCPSGGNVDAGRCTFVAVRYPSARISAIRSQWVVGWGAPQECRF